MATAASSGNTGLTFDGFEMSTYGLHRGARMYRSLQLELEQAFLTWAAEAERAAKAIGDAKEQAAYRSKVIEPATKVQKAIYQSVSEFAVALDAARGEYSAAELAAVQEIVKAGS